MSPRHEYQRARTIKGQRRSVGMMLRAVKRIEKLVDAALMADMGTTEARQYLNERVCELRSEGRTQRETARRLGIAQCTVCRIEAALNRKATATRKEKKA